MDVTLLYFDDCPSWRQTSDLLDEIAELSDDLTIVRRVVDTPDEAIVMRFRGSPSVQIAGVDLFARGDEPVGLSCRIYQTPDGPAGSPTFDQLTNAIEDHLAAP